MIIYKLFLCQGQEYVAEFQTYLLWDQIPILSPFLKWRGLKNYLWITSVNYLSCVYMPKRTCICGSLKHQAYATNVACKSRFVYHDTSHRGTCCSAYPFTHLGSRCGWVPEAFSLDPFGTLLHVSNLVAPPHEDSPWFQRCFCQPMEKTNCR